MKVLVTGALGQLGRDVMERLEALGLEHLGVDRQDFDLAEGEAVRRCLAEYRPDAVIHCAAYTAVDRAETEREACYAANVTATENVARACAEIGAKMLYISTDYVFDGQGETPFQPQDARAPVNYYGQTKTLGEDVVNACLDRRFIVRISWAFGVHGANFVKTMLRLGAERPEVRVVCDQVGSPTYTADLAALLCDMIQTERYGVYHATNEGFCSWSDFAAAIMEEAGLPCQVVPIPAAQYPTPAARPANSRMSKDALTAAGFSLLPPWQDALRRFLHQLKLEQA